MPVSFVCFSPPSPAVARTRFSPTSGTTSAIVPRAANAVASSRNARYVSPTRAAPTTALPMPQASLNATPAPHRCGFGYGCPVGPGSRGWTTAAQSGSSRVGRRRPVRHSWWSVTIRSTPRSRATLAGSTAVTPQSTVTISFAPRWSHSSATASAFSPYPSSSRCGM